MNEKETLRENIRQAIRLVKRKNQVSLNEEYEFRKLLRSSILQEKKLMEATPDNNPTPNKSTGINVLEDLLKKIIPVLETDYKLLTTSAEQRESFRSHILNGIVNTLTATKTNNEAAPEDEINEKVNVDLQQNSNPLDDKFIDIRSPKEIADEEEENDPVKDFGLEGKDETGRNMAYQSYQKIESNIIDSYELLSNQEDQGLFYDYLIANIKLYFDKFESQLSSNLQEPTNQAYKDARKTDSVDTQQSIENMQESLLKQLDKLSKTYHIISENKGLLKTAILSKNRTQQEIKILRNFISIVKKTI